MFDRVRRLGSDTALVGWFHPYGRQLNRSLTRCYWTASWLLPGIEEPTELGSLRERLEYRLKLQLSIVPLAGHVWALSPLRRRQEQKTKRLTRLLEHAREVVADASIGLSFIHLPIPHSPAVYAHPDRPVANGPLTYLDGLMSADDIFGDLRSTMERAGVWDDTTVLVSSDHGWRTSMWRVDPTWTAAEEAAAGNRDNLGVPFLLKMPRATSRMDYDNPFNTVLSADLIIEIMSGRVSSATQVADWLDAADEFEKK